MTRRRQRWFVIGAGVVILSLALTLAMFGLKRSAAFFITPSELAESQGTNRSVRVGGLVTQLDAEDAHLLFTLADDSSHIVVLYDGPVPDLFRVGQCVIAEGTLGADGRFVAERVLAKHDESYIPKEIGSAERLAQSCGSSAVS